MAISIVAFLWLRGLASAAEVGLVKDVEAVKKAEEEGQVTSLCDRLDR